MTARRPARSRFAVLAALAGTALLGGCAVAPEYLRPKVDLPVTWKLEPPFRTGAPADSAPKGPWWERFGDERLNALASQAMERNATLALASARFAQARATLAANSSLLFPQLNLAARDNRFRITENRPLTNYRAPNFSTTQDDYAASFVVSYEPDLQGRVSGVIAGARASAEQSAADLENFRLLVVSDLATAYFNLRQTDIEIDVLARSIDLQRRTLGVARTRYELGAASGLDVSQQQALIDTTLTQVDLLRRQRAQFENAIATLTGTPAPSFSLPADPRDLTPPAVPLGIPSDLLERRPDVASAERAMAAANAQIGVANTAFYPSINLAGAAGMQSRTTDTLFSAPSLIWSLGVSALVAIFDGGRAQANVDFAKAGYDATVALYRRTVINAMQETQDAISGLAALERAHAQSLVAVQSARRTLELVNARFEGGIAGPLEVITAQQGLLGGERLASQLAGQRLLTSVFLVKALGGGWEGPAKLSQN